MKQVTKERKADQWIDEITQCVKIVDGVKTIDKHYLEVVEEIRKDIIKNLK